MSARLKSAKIWMGAFLLLMGTIFALVEIQRWYDVAAVQDVVERNWEITFGAKQRPALLPESIDTAIYNYLVGKYDHESGVGARHTELQGYILHERFRALFRRPIQNIEIRYPEGIRGDVGAALQRFPALQRVTLEESGGMSESEFKVLCRRLRQLANLEELTLIAMPATDAALAEFAGHRRLRSITIVGGAFTIASATTFASMPALRQLELDRETANGDEWLTPEIAKEMRAVLPGVIIQSQ